jgi:hypothetical protein
MENDRRGYRKMVTPRDEVERYIELYVIWDKKTYGKNHKRISPPSAYFSWHKFARKNGVDDQWARIMEPSRQKRGTEKIAKEIGFLDKDDYLWTRTLHYGLIFDELWRKRNGYTLEEKYLDWLKRNPEASYRVRGDLDKNYESNI